MGKSDKQKGNEKARSEAGGGGGAGGGVGEGGSEGEGEGGEDAVKDSDTGIYASLQRTTKKKAQSVGIKSKSKVCQ